MYKEIGQTLRTLPISFHLWCAERELRLTDVSHLSPELRNARKENLGKLRDYRLAKSFPENARAPQFYTPCFVDDDGRMCAVAHLMRSSGEDKTVAEIVRTTNFARIAEMDETLLTPWMEKSGLEKRELARIQPGYPFGEQAIMPSNIEELKEMARGFAYLVSVLCFFSLGSIILNATRLWWRYLHQFSVFIGTFTGLTLLALTLLGTDSWRLMYKVSWYDSNFWLRDVFYLQGIIMILAVVSISLALLRFRDVPKSK
jgi:hypothetical protein